MMKMWRWLFLYRAQFLTYTSIPEIKQHYLQLNIEFCFCPRTAIGIYGLTFVHPSVRSSVRPVAISKSARGSFLKLSTNLGLAYATIGTFEILLAYLALFVNNDHLTKIDVLANFTKYGPRICFVLHTLNVCWVNFGILFSWKWENLESFRQMQRLWFSWNKLSVMTPFSLFWQMEKFTEKCYISRLL